MTIFRFLPIISVLVAAVACTRAKQSADERSAGNLLYINTSVRPFSDATKSDTLKASVNGESFLTGQVYLQINSYQGKDIFHTTFPVAAFIAHSSPVDPEPDEQAVQKELNKLFADRNFTLTAATASSPATVAFSFPVSQDSINQITYQKSSGQVIQTRIAR